MNAAKHIEAPGGARPGAIVLARHGEPGLSRKVLLNAAEYDAWWGRYEETGLLPGQTPPAGLVAQAGRSGVRLSSTRIRSIETARAVCGDARFDSLPILIEAPLPPPHWPDWFKLPPRQWGFITRVWWWFFNHHDGQESRAQAEARADQAADQLIAARRRGPRRPGAGPRLLQHPDRPQSGQAGLEADPGSRVQILVYAAVRTTLRH